MTLSQVAAENEDQAAYWNGPSGVKWVDHQSQMDKVLDPLGQIALDVAGPDLGERIIDIGCGCGATSILLADRVGRQGKVLGVDISEPMLGLARQRAGDRTQVEFRNADASVYDFTGFEADQLFSRFGVMFFRDPVKAFANIRKGLKSGARLTFVCWRPLPLNGWMYTPLQSALSIIPAPPPTAPDEPGPFAFADDSRVTALLSNAGFSDIKFTPADRMMTLGRAGNSADDFKTAVDFAIMFGPLGRLLGEMDKTRIADVRQAIEKGLESHRTQTGVKLPAAVWIVTARNS